MEDDSREGVKQLSSDWKTAYLALFIWGGLAIAGTLYLIELGVTTSDPLRRLRRGLVYEHGEGI